MDRIPIASGAYQSRSIISGSQRCINLFPEINEDEQAPTPVTHFPTPGLTLKAASPNQQAGRALYTAKTGDVFEVCGVDVYYVSPTFQYTLLGQLLSNLASPVLMIDNGLVVLIVDNTGAGFAINLADRSFAQVTDPNFLGGTRVGYVDGFFVLNVPGTNSWYISLLFVTFANLTQGFINPGNLYAAFDPLDIVGKVGASDDVASIIIMHRVVWIIGNMWSSESFYNAGGADFPFSIVEGVFFEHGTVAAYSLATQDLAIFFLQQDRYGARTVVRINADFSIDQISTRGIEFIFNEMIVVSDAIGGCYQQNGHSFYVITFPTSNRTFACELKTGQWHELAWTDANGQLNRHRANAWALGYGINLVIDWQNGNIYQLDVNNYTDFGGPITRLRTVPHVIASGERLRAEIIMADLQGGTLTSATADNPPKVFLSTSTDRGATYGEPVEGYFGAAGDYAGFPTWRNQGMARDFVFQVSWSEPINTAFNGLFASFTKAVGDG